MSRDLFDPAVLSFSSVVIEAKGLPFPPMPAPPYRRVDSGDWSFDEIHLAACRGYFTGPQTVPWPVPVLRRGKVVWMSLTPTEAESQMPYLAAAKGTVVVCGFGLGLMAYATAGLKAVNRVIVVERDPEVIRMGKAFSDFENWPQRHKVDIVQQDALTFTCQDADFLYADIWPYYRMDCMVPHMQAMHANIPTPTCGYWGQEIDMVDYAAAQGVADADFSLRHVEQFCRDHGLPLIGAEFPDYAQLCVKAARNPVIGATRRPIEKLTA